MRKPRTDAVKVFERVAESGKPVRAKPEEYVEELEERSKVRKRLQRPQL